MSLEKQTDSPTEREREAPLRSKGYFHYSKLGAAMATRNNWAWCLHGFMLTQEAKKKRRFSNEIIYVTSWSGLNPTAQHGVSKRVNLGGPCFNYLR